MPKDKWQLLSRRIYNSVVRTTLDAWKTLAKQVLKCPRSSKVLGVIIVGWFWMKEQSIMHRHESVEVNSWRMCYERVSTFPRHCNQQLHRALPLPLKHCVCHRDHSLPHIEAYKLMIFIWQISLWISDKIIQHQKLKSRPNALKIIFEGSYSPK